MFTRIQNINHGVYAYRSSITVSVNSRDLPVDVQGEYRFSQFSEEGTDIDIHREHIS